MSSTAGPDGVLFATIAWRRFKNHPVGLLVLTESHLTFQPATLLASTFGVPLSDLVETRPAMLGTWLRLQARRERWDVYFATGGNTADQKPPAHWNVRDSPFAELAEGGGDMAESAALLNLLPDLPYGDLFKLGGAVSGVFTARRLTTTWIAAIDRARTTGKA